MTNSCRQNLIGLGVAQAKREVVFIDERLDVAVLQQGLGPERLKVVSTTATGNLIEKAVHALDVPVRISGVEVVKDQSSPSLLAHERHERFERRLELLRHQLAPGVKSLLCIGAGLGAVDVIEPFLEGDGLLNGRVLSEYPSQFNRVVPIKAMRAAPKDGDLPLQFYAVLVARGVLNGLPNRGNRPVRVPNDMEAVDHDRRGLEVLLVDLLVCPVHVLGDDLDLHAVLVGPAAEVLDQHLFLPRGQDVEQNAFLYVTNDEPGVTTHVLLVHAHDAREVERVVLQSLGGMVLEDAADEAFLHAVDVTAQGELEIGAVFGQLVAEADRHVPLRVDAWQILQENSAATAAPVPLSFDAQVRLFSLDWEVAEVNYAGAVLDNIWLVTGTRRDLFRDQNGLNIKLPVLFLGHRPHEAVQTQQIKTRHSNPPKRREHEPFGATCQMRNAA